MQVLEYAFSFAYNDADIMYYAIVSEKIDSYSRYLLDYKLGDNLKEDEEFLRKLYDFNPDLIKKIHTLAADRIRVSVLYGFFDKELSDNSDRDEGRKDDSRKIA